MGKFAAPKPLAAPGSRKGNVGFAIPKASSIAVGSPNKKQRTKEAATAPVMLHVCRYTDCGAAFNENFAMGDPVDQVQIEHNARPSVLFMMMSSLNKFLEDQVAKECEGPKDVKQWEEQWRCRMVLTGKEDPEKVGYVPWRIAFYVSGGPLALKNFLLFFDSFCHWRTTALTDERFEAPATLNILHDATAALDVSPSDFDCATTVTAVDKSSRMSPLRAHPPHWCRKIVFINVEVVDDERVALVIGGNTHPYRAAFEDLGIQGGFQDESGSAEYFRVIPEFHANDVLQRTLITQMMGAACLKNSVVGVRTSGSWKEETPAHEFLAFLYAFPGAERI